MQLEDGELAEDVIDDSVLVDHVEELSEGGEGSVGGGQIDCSLHIYHLYIAGEVQIEEAVVIATELLHLIEEGGGEDGQIGDDCLAIEEPEE